MGTLMDKSRHSSSVQFHYGMGTQGKQGNPVVGALVWESDHLSPGPYIAVNCVTEQSELDSVLHPGQMLCKCIGWLARLTKSLL